MQPTPGLPELPVAPIPTLPLAPVLAPTVPEALIDGRRALVVMESTHLRRCVFRRVSVVTPTGLRGRAAAAYEVECGHPSLVAPLTLGDLPDARTACAACRLPGVFRADED